MKLEASDNILSLLKLRINCLFFSVYMFSAHSSYLSFNTDLDAILAGPVLFGGVPLGADGSSSDEFTGLFILSSYSLVLMASVTVFFFRLSDLLSK
jgi:hypothetical protein